MTKNMKITTLLSALALALAAGAARADEPIDEKPYFTASDTAKETVQNSCAICHSADGVARWGYIPSLAGLDKTYLVDQLKGLRAHNRMTFYSRRAMWGMTGMLNDGEIDALADYFSALPGPAGEKPLWYQHPDLDLGKNIFEKGLSDRSVPACATCHVGGRGDVNIPRVAGQHAEYLTRAMHDFKHGFRVNDNMNFITGKMTGAEIEAVSAYMASLDAPNAPAASKPAGQ
jgi:cytochrome c553